MKKCTLGKVRHRYSTVCVLILKDNKTKVLSVQLGKTFSFVKFVVEWVEWGGGCGRGGTLGSDVTINS